MGRNLLSIAGLILIIVGILHPTASYADWLGPTEVLSGKWGNHKGEFGFAKGDSGDLFPREFSANAIGKVFFSDQATPLDPGSKAYRDDGLEEGRYSAFDCWLSCLNPTYEHNVAGMGDRLCCSIEENRQPAITIFRKPEPFNQDPFPPGGRTGWGISLTVWKYRLMMSPSPALPQEGGRKNTLLPGC